MKFATIFWYSEHFAIRDFVHKRFRPLLPCVDSLIVLYSIDTFFYRRDDCEDAFAVGMPVADKDVRLRALVSLRLNAHERVHLPTIVSLRLIMPKFAGNVK